MRSGLTSWLRTTVLMLRISLRADAARSVGVVVTAVGQLASAPFLALGLKRITDGVLAHSPNQATRGAVVVAVVAAVGRLSTHSSFNLRMRLRENTQLYLDAELMRTTAGIAGLEHHERADYLDEVERLRAERGYLANPFNPISWSLASVVALLTVVVLLWQVDPLLALFPLAGIPTAVITGRFEAGFVAMLDAHAEPQRRQRHLLELTTEAAAAKEVRLSRLGPALLARRRAGFEELEAIETAYSLRRLRATTLGVACFAGGFGLAILWAVHLAETGRITVGSVVLVLSLGAQIDAQVAESSSYLAWFVRTHRAVRRLRWFEDYANASRAALTPPEPAAVPARLNDGIRFEGVAFAYPGTDRAVLRGVDLHLPAGCTVAIVGEKGAGKTTLVKLLARFYEPTAGRVLVDGVPLTSFEVEAWRSCLSAGFQDFTRFRLLAREVVGLGDLSQPMEAPVLLAALDRAASGSVLAALPAGLDTQLGRDFDGGVDVSLGQWQKLAMGRGMMRTGPLLRLLDEPTASLDALTEHALFERFHDSAREARERGAITVLVSHRFSTVRMADLILVVDGGRIAEAGTHNELMALAGTYAELYELQARSYR
jgi:ATP-binding cassette subfamily B protein